jgi:hypothetical protein
VATGTPTISEARLIVYIRALTQARENPPETFDKGDAKY